MSASYPTPISLTALVASLTVLCATSAPAVCAAATPVGTDGSRVLSRYEGKPLRVVGNAAQPSSGETDAGQRYHVVAPGETLWSISRRYGSSVEQVSVVNELSDPTQISVGQKLRLPPSSTTNAPAAPSKMSSQPTQAEGPKRSVVEPKPKSEGKLSKKPPAPPPVSKRRKKVKPSKRYPLLWPVEGKVSSRYGKRWGRAHDGIDIGAPEGTAVHASAAGEVLFSSKHGSYGNLVVIKHANRLVTVYAHHQRNLVRKGQRVEAGQLIGRVGQTGRATGPHLHFEVRRGTSPENPMRLLPP